MDNLGFLLVVGAIVAIAALAYYAYKKEQERIARLLAYATSQGADFMPLGANLDTGFWSRPSGDTRLLDTVTIFGSTKPFGQGHSRKISNAIVLPEGVRGYEMIFDYEYKITTSNGKSTQTTTYPFRVHVSRLPIVLPQLCVEPENLGHRIAEKFGLREIEFEFEEFNRRFFVTGGDRETAYGLLHPEMLEYLLSIHPVRMQFCGPAMMVLEAGKLDVLDLERMRTQAKGFVERIPEYLWEDRGIRAN